MTRSDIEFKTSDGTILRGWFFPPSSSSSSSSSTSGATKSPCIVMSHGWSALKEMSLDAFATHFTTHLPIAALVYDNRNFGASDGQPRQEIIPATQISDMQDAITYVQGREDVDREKVGIWGSSYSGGHVLQVTAVDRRVKVVVSQAPLVSGWENAARLVRSDFWVGMLGMLQEDRLARAAGKPPGMLPVVDQNPQAPSALPTPDSYAFFTEWEKKSDWKNEVTLKSIDGLRGYDPGLWIHRISPTPLLMVVASNDVLTPTDLALEAYSRAREPKELYIFPGGHFDAYSGRNFDKSVAVQTAFIKKWLVDTRKMEQTAG